MSADGFMLTAEVADRLRISPRKVREVALSNGIGFNAGGRAGYRFSAADVDLLVEAMRPEPPVKKRRRNRGAA